MLFFFSVCFLFSFILGGYCDYWIQLYVLVVPLAQVSSIFNWRANNSFSSQTKLRTRRARLNDDGRDGPRLARLGQTHHTRIVVCRYIKIEVESYLRRFPSEAERIPGLACIFLFYFVFYFWVSIINYYKNKLIYCCYIYMYFNNNVAFCYYLVTLN